MAEEHEVSWQGAEKVFDWDPYQCWAHDVNPGRNTLGLVPVVIELSAGPDNRSYAALAESLELLRQQLDLETTGDTGWLFRASESDQEHLERSRIFVQRQLRILGDAAEDEVPDYTRLLLLYAREDRLFPRAEAPVYWEAEHFKILYVGQPQPFDKGRERGDSGSGTSQGPVDITVIDDSFAVLNDVFWTKDGPVFKDVWIQSKVQQLGDTLSTGAFLEARDLIGLRNDSDGKPDAEAYETKFIDWKTETHHPLAHDRSHGTHVAATVLKAYASLAANGDELELRGIAIPTEVTQDTSGATLGSYLIPAIRQAMLWNDEKYDPGAGDRDFPLVITCSYGFTAGPKDGSDPLSSVIARLLAARNALSLGGKRRTALVLPMGNSYEDRLVARKTLASGETLELDWVLLPDDRTPSFLEMYARGITEGAKPGTPAALRIEIIPPTPHLPGLDQPATGATLTSSTHLKRGHNLLASLNEWAPEDGSAWTWKGCLAVAPTTSLEDPQAACPPGRWRLKITNTAEFQTDLMLTVQRDDAPGTYPVVGRQSYLDSAEEAWVLGDYANSGLAGEDAALQQGPHALTTSYDRLGPNCPITYMRTASALASINSKYVFVAGAGVGDRVTGEPDPEQIPLPEGPADDAPSGPRIGELVEGPDFTGTADRGPERPGIFAAGTASGTSVLMNGSSVAAPQAAAQLAVWMQQNRPGMTLLNAPNTYQQAWGSKTSTEKGPVSDAPQHGKNRAGKKICLLG